MTTGKAGTQTSTIGKSKEFFGDCVDELKKVTTPTRQETVQATLVAVVIIVFVAVALLLLDFVFNRVMGALLAS